VGGHDLGGSSFHLLSFRPYKGSGGVPNAKKGIPSCNDSPSRHRGDGATASEAL
jgi:hypothetical protein